MTNSTNVWTDLSNNSSIRIDLETPFNFFWIKDISGRFGFHIKFYGLTFNGTIVEKLKGITVVKGIQDGTLTDFALWLNSNNDWQLFLALCNDLLSVSTPCVNETGLFNVINKRLQKWQRFLSNDNSFSMTEIKQMGLFAELLCLKNMIIPNFEISQALISWVGPDYHKQDFSLPNLLIEVKSYITSKGPLVKISSANQLVCDIKPLFLLSYGLTRDDLGSSIVNLIDEITLIIDQKHGDIDIFNLKLSEYGYIDGLTPGPFSKFRQDIIRSYTVNDSFPKIVPNLIDDRIVALEYSIDLAKCGEFITEPISLFN